MLIICLFLFLYFPYTAVGFYTENSIFKTLKKLQFESTRFWRAKVHCCQNNPISDLPKWLEQILKFRRLRGFKLVHSRLRCEAHIFTESSFHKVESLQNEELRNLWATPKHESQEDKLSNWDSQSNLTVDSGRALESQFRFASKLSSLLCV